MEYYSAIKNEISFPATWMDLEITINQALGSTKVKGLGGDKKARKRGSQSWEQFLRDNPNRVL